MSKGATTIQKKEPDNLLFKAHPSRLTTSQKDSLTGTRSRPQEMVWEIPEYAWTRRGVLDETGQSEDDRQLSPGKQPRGSIEPAVSQQ